MKGIMVASPLFYMAWLEKVSGEVASERDLRESGCEVWLSWRKEPRVEKHCVSRPAVWSVLDVAMDSKEPGERGGDRGKLRGWSKSGV